MSVFRLRTFWEMVSDYNSRDFTYPGDVVDAFKGVEAYLKPVCGEFIFGLPEKAFNATIRWEPTKSGVNKRKTEKTLPSWSWMAWQTGVKDWSLPFSDKKETIRWSIRLDGKRIKLGPATDRSRLLSPLGQRPHVQDISFEGKEPPLVVYGKGQYLRVRLATYGGTSYILDPKGLAFGRVKVGDEVGQPAAADRKWILEDGELISVRQGKETADSSDKALETPYGDEAFELYGLPFLRQLTKKEWQYHFVMLVETNEGVAYRRGLGWAVADVWDKLSKKGVDITLG